MIRISSYSIYIFVILIPGVIIGIVTQVGWTTPSFLAIFLIPLFAGLFYIVYRARRVYFNELESALYLLGLFSNKTEMVKKDQGIRIEKRDTSSFRDYGIYKLTYWITNDRVEVVWFTINGLLDNPDDIIEKINSL